MDEEEEYGIPHYSSQGSFQNYTENFPSSFDGHLEDTLDDGHHDSFGECMRPTLV